MAPAVFRYTDIKYLIEQLIRRQAVAVFLVGTSARLTALSMMCCGMIGIAVDIPRQGVYLHFIYITQYRQAAGHITVKGSVTG